MQAWLISGLSLNWARTSSKLLKNNFSNQYYSDSKVTGVIYKEVSGNLV